MMVDLKTGAVTTSNMSGFQWTVKVAINRFIYTPNKKYKKLNFWQ